MLISPSTRPEIYTIPTQIHTNRVSAKITGATKIFNNSFSKNTNALIVMPPLKITVPVPDSIIPVS